ncbi:MAG: GIY-YIG nuclease family protein [Candidatus Paceibacterota bacterium]|jgi:putative endonuclease
MYSVYIVQCNDDTLYTGIAVDLTRRTSEHNSSKRGAKYTRARRPVRLVYSKKFRDKSAALRAEIQIKKLSRNDKLTLIK